jgi:hypothetical protein
MEATGAADKAVFCGESAIVTEVPDPSSAEAVYATSPRAVPEPLEAAVASVVCVLAATAFSVVEKRFWRLGLKFSTVAADESGRALEKIPAHPAS